MKRVLLIDDEQDFCYFVKKNLERLGGYEVEVCNDAAMAIERIRQFHPDLILLDIVMPGVSGTDIACMLRETPDIRHIPYAFLTALIERNEVAGYNSMGKELMISKPVQLEDLRETLERMMFSKAAHDAS